MCSLHLAVDIDVDAPYNTVDIDVDAFCSMGALHLAVGIDVDAFYNNTH